MPSDTPQQPPAAGRPVIIDTDPGIDDAMAIWLALVSPELDVRAITTASGNHDGATTTRNAGRILAAASRTDIPIARGAGRPLARPAVSPLTDVHGVDGLGDAGFADGPEPIAGSTLELLAATIEASARPLTLIAIGPLTNVALLDAVYPELVERLERIILMGGAARGGNATPTAEFNMFYDPESARRVFDLAVPVTMIGLDVTTRVVTDLAVWQQLSTGSAIARQVYAMNAHYAAFYRTSHGAPVTVQHDSLAVAAAIDGTLFEFRDANVEVECSSTLTAGTTVVHLHGDPERHNATVAFDVDVERFTDLLIPRIHGLFAEPDK